MEYLELFRRTKLFIMEAEIDSLRVNIEIEEWFAFIFSILKIYLVDIFLDFIYIVFK